MAEKEGFEPSIPFWGIHDFQSCALDQTTRLLHAELESLFIIKETLYKVNRFLKKTDQSKNRAAANTMSAAALRSDIPYFP